MANPMDALKAYQLRAKEFADPDCLVEGYYRHQGPKGDRGGFTIEYLKIVNYEVQAVAIFGVEHPLNRVDRFSVGYAVAENYRRRGLAFEIVNFGIKDLAKQVRAQNVRRFLVEAVIDRTNKPSIELAKKIFLQDGRPIVEGLTDTPALHFIKTVEAAF